MFNKTFKITLLFTLLLVLFGFSSVRAAALVLPKVTLGGVEYELPATPANSSTFTKYFIYYDYNNKQFYVYYFHSGGVVYFDTTTGNLVLEKNKDRPSHISYYYNPTSTSFSWVSNSSNQNVTATFTHFNVDNEPTTNGKMILASNVDMTFDKDESKPFFPRPLLEENPTLTQILKMTPEVATEIIAKMRTILLCGVGCLALLISLPLLLRAFSRFRS